MCKIESCRICEYGKVRALFSRKARRECKVRCMKRMFKGAGLGFVFILVGSRI